MAAVLGAILFLAMPALASAERIYYLVGLRHVYSIGPNRDAHWRERQAIEENYADKVAQYQDEYNQRLANGGDPAQESDLLNQGLNDLAQQRDRQLSEYFELRDDIREQHPELQVDGDGPYQVMGINYHRRSNLLVFDNFCVYAPWPGYVVVNRPYGWSYGVVYNPYQFTQVYVGWHRNYISMGRPAFFGFVGHGGIEITASIGFGRSSGGGRTFVPVLHDSRGFHPAPRGYRPPINRSIRVSATSAYGHPARPVTGGGRAFGGSMRPGGGSFGKPGMPARSPYGTSSRPPLRSGGSFGAARPTGSRPTGSFGKPSGTRPAGSFGSPRPSGSFGAPRDSSRKPSGSFGAPKEAARKPSGSFGAPREASHKPSGSFGAPREASHKPSGGSRDHKKG